MKQARNSDSRNPYTCLKPWPENCFVQCGGHGVVFENLDKAFQKPEETIKAIAGGPSSLGHYHTAFFEAFPKDPSCFLRGEGSSIELAEEDCFKKWQTIQNCSSHEFDRKGRTDGYAYCTKCSYSSTVLDPVTTCVDCGTPTAKTTDNKDNHRCWKHHYLLPLDQVTCDKYGDLVKEVNDFYFQKDQVLAKHFLKEDPNLSEKEFNEIKDKYHRWNRSITHQYKPLIGKQTKTDEEIIQILTQELPDFLKEINRG